MSNSPLVNYTKISPNKTSPRNHAIDTVTIHSYVGQVTVEQAGDWFSNPNCEASCNYAIGRDGKIALIVDEKDRSWCSSNRDNDHRAITIEVASANKHPYNVTAEAYESLIKLLADICKRNNIKELKWKAEKSLIGQPDKQNMTVHRWFANKACPGEYLYSRHSQIAAEVNARLTSSSNSSSSSGSSSSSSSSKTEIKQGDTVSICNNAVYYTGSDVPTWVIRKKWIVKKVQGNRVVVDKSADGKNAINSAIDAKYLTVVKKKSEFPYMVQVKTDELRIRTGPGTGYPVNYNTPKKGVTGIGIFTITEAKTGKGSKTGWGKLKSGDGWISLDYAKRV